MCVYNAGKKTCRLNFFSVLTYKLHNSKSFQHISQKQIQKYQLKMIKSLFYFTTFSTLLKGATNRRSNQKHLAKQGVLSMNYYNGQTGSLSLPQFEALQGFLVSFGDPDVSTQ